MPARPWRRWLVILAVTAIALNVAGFFRYPGGPLRDATADGPIWLDLRPADHGWIGVGNTQPSDWAIAGRSYTFELTVRNTWPMGATIEGVTPIDTTPGLRVEGVAVLRAGATRGDVYAFGPFGQGPTQVELERDYAPVPASIAAASDTAGNDTSIILTLGSDRPGAFGFSALDLTYRVGPFAFHALQHYRLSGCLGPLATGESCPDHDD